MKDMEIDQLVAQHILNSPFEKPRHGTCCTCQTCGHMHEECVCGCGTWWDKIDRLIEVMQNRGYHFLMLMGSARPRLATASFHNEHSSGMATDTKAGRAVGRAALEALGICPSES